MIGDSITDFFAGRANVVKTGDLIISRELSKGSQLLHFNYLDSEWTMWASPAQEKKERKGNYTGGKKPYNMVMIGKLKELVNTYKKGEAKGNVYEQIGVMNELADNTDFGSGRIVSKRKKAGLGVSDMSKVLGVSVRKMERVLSDMKSNGLIEKKEDGYYISRDYIKKGGKKR